MDIVTLLVLLCAVAAGSYLQAVAGFALGMVVIAVVGAYGGMPISVLAAVTSLLSFINVAYSLRGRWRELHWPLMRWMALGQIIAIWAGVQLLSYLEADQLLVMQALLGLFITLGSLAMLVRPQPQAAVSGPAGALGAGLAGGLVGGMFSASGPVMGWFLYRQPMPFATIRATLLTFFLMTTLARTIIVGFDGALTREVWGYFAFALPVVLAATWLGRNFPPRFSEARMKQTAFGLLLACGLWILGGVAISL